MSIPVYGVFVDWYKDLEIKYNLYKRAAAMHCFIFPQFHFAMSRRFLLFALSQMEQHLWLV